ncbi:MAG: cation transporter [Akkermansiaceae bacterium]|nr:cation transporter [Akkermansiaceae bacterium]
MKIAFSLNLAFTVIEFFGGWISGSVAILSDAVHDLGDTAGLGLALVLERIAARSRPTARYTYGKHRWTLVGALVNALILVFGSALILREAVERLQSAAEPRGLWMLGFACLGVAVNGYAAWRNSRGKTLNEKVISWHLLEDVIGWVAVLIGAVVLMQTNWTWIDPALAIAISLFILFNVVRRLREVTATFLQAAPAEIDMDALKAELAELPEVASIHDLHAWSLDGERHVVSCHAVLPAGAGTPEYSAARGKLRDVLSREFPGHVTVELEFDGEPCPERPA